MYKQLNREAQNAITTIESLIEEVARLEELITERDIEIEKLENRIEELVNQLTT